MYTVYIICIMCAVHNIWLHYVYAIAFFFCILHSKCVFYFNYRAARNYYWFYKGVWGCFFPYIYKVMYIWCCFSAYFIFTELSIGNTKTAGGPYLVYFENLETPFAVFSCSFELPIAACYAMYRTHPRFNLNRCRLFCHICNSKFRKRPSIIIATSNMHFGILFM